MDESVDWDKSGTTAVITLFRDNQVMIRLPFLTTHQARVYAALAGPGLTDGGRHVSRVGFVGGHGGQPVGDHGLARQAHGGAVNLNVDQFVALIRVHAGLPKWRAKGAARP